MPWGSYYRYSSYFRRYWGSYSSRWRNPFRYSYKPYGFGLYAAKPAKPAYGPSQPGFVNGKGPAPLGASPTTSSTNPNPLDTNNDGLVDNRYYYTLLDGNRQVSLRDRWGRRLSDRSSRYWDVDRSLSTGYGFKLLLKGEGYYKGKFKLWDANRYGSLSYTSGGWKTADQAARAGWEDIFKVDLNKDGRIGNKPIAPGQPGFVTNTYALKLLPGSGWSLVRLQKEDGSIVTLRAVKKRQSGSGIYNDTFTYRDNPVAVIKNPDGSDSGRPYLILTSSGYGANKTYSQWFIDKWNRVQLLEGGGMGRITPTDELEKRWNIDFDGNGITGKVDVITYETKTETTSTSEKVITGDGIEGNDFTNTGYDLDNFSRETTQTVTTTDKFINGEFDSTTTTTSNPTLAPYITYSDGVKTEQKEVIIGSRNSQIEGKAVTFRPGAYAHNIYRASGYGSNFKVTGVKDSWVFGNDGTANQLWIEAKANGYNSSYNRYTEAIGADDVTIALGDSRYNKIKINASANGGFNTDVTAIGLKDSFVDLGDQSSYRSWEYNSLQIDANATGRQLYRYHNRWSFFSQSEFEANLVAEFDPSQYDITGLGLEKQYSWSTSRYKISRKDAVEAVGVQNSVINGGDGVDEITINSNGTLLKDSQINLGGGNDRLIFGGEFQSIEGSTIDGGDGVDNLRINGISGREFRENLLPSLGISGDSITFAGNEFKNFEEITFATGRWNQNRETITVDQLKTFI